VLAKARAKRLVLAQEVLHGDRRAGEARPTSGIFRRLSIASMRAPMLALFHESGKKPPRRAWSANPPTIDSRKSVTSGGDESSLNSP
jgi:hypothetical protein